MPVRIVAIAYDPPGWDVAGEYVLLQNVGTSVENLQNWILHDVANNQFKFPAFSLQPGGEVRVWTKAGANDPSNLFWGRTQAVWNNYPGDTAVLRNALGDEVDRHSYGRTPGQRIVVPAFFDSAHIGDFQNIAGFAPTVRIVVLDFNVWVEPLPGTLSDAAVLQNLRNLIQGYQAAKIRVLGYVPTDGGTGAPGVETQPLHTSGTETPKRHTPTQIKSWIDHWYSLFTVRPDGIFLDEGPEPFRFNGRAAPGMPVEPAIRAFYVDLHQHVHTFDAPNQPQQIVMLNAAYYRDDVDWVLGKYPDLPAPAAEIALLWEETAAKYLQTGSPPNQYPANPPAWWTDPRYAPSRIAHTVHGCPPEQLCETVMLSKQRGAGYLYVFDGTSRAYKKLPGYWPAEVVAVREGCRVGGAVENVQDVCVAPLSDKRLELWVVETGGGLSSTWKVTTNPNATWTSWADFLAEVGALPAAARQAIVAPLSDGRLELWVSDANGGLWSCWKITTNSNANWTGWSDFLAEVGGLPGGARALAVAPLPDGRLEFWAVDGNGGLWSCWKITTNPNANWSGWNNFFAEVGGLPAGARQVAVAPLSDGRLELWVVDASGSVWTTWKLTTSPNANWAPWSDFLAEVGQLPASARDVCVGRLPDGRLEVWVSDANGGLWSCWKITTNSNANWTGWSDFLAEVGGLPGGARALAVAPLPDGRLEFWAVDGNGGLWSCWKITTNPNANWTGWSDFLAEVNAS